MFRETHLERMGDVFLGMPQRVLEIHRPRGELGANTSQATRCSACEDRTRHNYRETHDVEWVGEDTVSLEGTLVAKHTVTLLGDGSRKGVGQTSTVVTRFSDLKLSGKSVVFGPVKVTLDKSVPAFGVVTASKGKADIGCCFPCAWESRSEPPAVTFSFEDRSHLKTVPGQATRRVITMASRAPPFLSYCFDRFSV